MALSIVSRYRCPTTATDKELGSHRSYERWKPGVGLHRDPQLPATGMVGGHCPESWATFCERAVSMSTDTHTHCLNISLAPPPSKPTADKSMD